MSTIEIRNISKNYGSTNALKKVSLTLGENKIYGLLGRNGAGKSTLLNIITNMLFSNTGEVLIDGEPMLENDDALSKVFYATDKNLFPISMKVYEGIEWTKEFCPTFDVDYAYDLADKFKLGTKKKINELSTGYQTIFRLILTLSANTPVVLYDEPVLGLDANHRELFYKELIAKYSESPQTVVLSTHLIDEISHIIEDVIIIKDGEIIITQPLEEVLQLAYKISGSSENVDQYTKGKNVIREETMGKFKAATIYQKRDNADKASIDKLGLEITPARLQELFICLANS